MDDDDKFKTGMKICGKSRENNNEKIRAKRATLPDATAEKIW